MLFKHSISFKAAAAQSKPQVILQAESYVADNTFQAKKMTEISLTALWRFYDGGASQAKAKKRRRQQMSSFRQKTLKTD